MPVELDPLEVPEVDPEPVEVVVEPEPDPVAVLPDAVVG